MQQGVAIVESRMFDTVGNRDGYVAFELTTNVLNGLSVKIR